MYKTDVISGLNHWYFKMTKVIDLRYSKLVSDHSNGIFNEFIKIAGRAAGRRPELHIETGLLDRVKNTEYVKHVRQFPKTEVAKLQEQLDKAEQLMTEDITFKGSVPKLIQATFNVFNACKFPNYKFQPVDLEYAYDNQLNHQASSGYPSFRRKGTLKDELIEQSTEMFENPNSKQWTWPITRGFRLQLRENEDIDMKIRVMYPYPGAIILLEDRFIVPFVEHFMNTDTFYVIGRNGKQISNLLKARYLTGTTTFSSDYKSYDQNLLNEVIILAFALLRSQLKLNSIEHKCFENICAYCCTSLAVSKTPGAPAYGFVDRKSVV